MHKKFLSVLFGVVFGVGLLAGNALAEPKAQQPIKTIAVLPVKDPEQFTVVGRAVNGLVPMGWIANKADSRAKTNLFTEAVTPLKIPFGKTLSTQIVEGLNTLGYQAFLLEDMKGPPEDPDYIDPKRLRGRADALLNVSISDIGMVVNGKDWHYFPNVSLEASLVSTSNEEHLYDETIYYGVYANKPGSWSVPSDPSFEYSTAESFIEKPEEAAMRLLGGAKEAVKRVVDNIKKPQ